MISFEFSYDVPTKVIDELLDANEYIRIAMFQVHNSRLITQLFFCKLSHKYPWYFNKLMTCQHNNVFRSATPH